MSYSAAIRRHPQRPYEIAALAGRIDSMSVAWDRHGCAEATIVARLSMPELLSLYEARGSPHVEISHYGMRIWAGRLERPSIRSRGSLIELTSYGYWRALSDLPYTQVAVDHRNALWRPLGPNDIADATPERGVFRADENGLWMAPSKNAIFGNTGTVESLYYGYRPPDGGGGITGIVVNGWLRTPGTNWELQLYRCDRDWTNAVLVRTWNGTPGNVSLAATDAWSPADGACYFRLYYAGADAALATETGSVRAEIQGTTANAPAIYGMSATSSSSQLIINDMLSRIALANPGQLQATLQARINAAPIATGSNGDVRVYEDAGMADVIDAFCLEAGAQAWVDHDRQLWYEARYAEAQSWRIEAADVEAGRDLDRVRNRAYAVYETVDGERVISADADDLASQDRVSLIREAAVAARGVVATHANAIRAAALADQANPSQRAGVTVRRVASRNGQIVGLHLPRPGDIAQIVNAPSYSGALGSALHFRIARTELGLERGRPPSVVLEPDEPTPRLETLLAQRG